jgi:ferredoxin
MSQTSSKVVIRHKASECVGCCLCAETIPQYFQMNEEGVSVLLDSKNEGVFNRTDALGIDSTNIEVAVEGCPVDIIRLSKS